MWDDVSQGFKEAAEGVADFIDNDAWEWWTPALGDWNLLDLTNHMMRAVATPAQYVAEPEPTGATLSSSAGYYAVYLAERAEDPGLDAMVAERGSAHELVAGTVVQAFRDAVGEGIAAVSDLDPYRKVPTPFGAMRVVDYLPTRTLELVVHGLDFAHAVDSHWGVPKTALAQAMGLVSEIARLTGKGQGFLMAATGRPWAQSVFPILI